MFFLGVTLLVLHLQFLFDVLSSVSDQGRIQTLKRHLRSLGAAYEWPCVLLYSTLFLHSGPVPLDVGVLLLLLLRPASWLFGSSPAAVSGVWIVLEFDLSKASSVSKCNKCTPILVSCNYCDSHGHLDVPAFPPFPV